MRPFAIATLAAMAVLAALPAGAQIVTAPKTYADAPQKLTEAEMQATFSGRFREDGTDIKNNDWTLETNGDGTLHVSAGAYTDSGKIWLDGLQLCISFSKWHGESRCYHYAHHGKQLASYGPDGKLDSVVTVSR